jgi:L-lactate dehydrogenase complex protein LldF
MSTTFPQFRSRARRGILDEHLQQALDHTTEIYRTGRVEALGKLLDSEALRDHLKAIRSSTLARLAEHLETFERQALAAGAQVHWAHDGTEANGMLIDIARRHGVKMAVKSKSMVSEEIRTNAALAEAGIKPVETDLGEWIIQLAGEAPSHIVCPAIHKTRQQVAELFSRELNRPVSTEIPALTNEARQTLREKFLAAGLGISGANMAVAETGSIVLVTNEGNGRMVTSLPPVHVAVVGIEKLVPTWADAAVWLELLARSATGQPLSVYTSVITGPARPDDPDGPQEVHVILLDNHRSDQIGTAYEEVLQCIRCGACLSVCPVYREVGGHTYGSPYSGPIGAVVSPLLFGLEGFEALPHASTLCGACLEVCPVRIDLPRMLLELRSQEVGERILPWYDRVVERLAASLLASSRRWSLLADLARRLVRPISRNGSLRLPGRLNPAQPRNLPTLSRRSFRAVWQDGEIGDET